MSAAISYSLYDVRFQDAGKGDAQGALLKYRFSNDQIGFASLSAWPKVADRSLADKLEDLKRDPRTEPQWSWALLDAQLRQEKHPALPIGSHLAQSHWHMRNSDSRSPECWKQLVALGHLCWKLKVSPSTVESIPFVELAKFARANSVRLRLDGNGTFTSLAELRSLLGPLANMSVIEFFEDPSPDRNLWLEIKQTWGVTLAADWFCPGQYPCDLVIHKPSRDRFVPEERDFVVTTAFDHPLGLNYTAYQSLQLRDHPRLRLPLGINHPDLYRCDGIESNVTFGAIGFGWGHLLENTPWHPL